MTNYAEPVASLIKLGDVRGGKQHDYLNLGITEEHIPELKRLALDEELLWAMSDTDEVWAPLHAWRALGQLKHPDGVETLIKVLSNTDDWDDDWSMEEPPELLTMIGQPAIEPLRSYLESASKHQLWGPVTAVNALEKIATKHPQLRAECVAVLTAQLEKFDEQKKEINGSLISSLRKLGAVEAAPLMEAAFAANKVDLSIDGDWEDTQIDLGLLDKRITPRPRYILDSWAPESDMAKASRALADKLDQQRSERRAANKRAKKSKQKQRTRAKKKKRR